MWSCDFLHGLYMIVTQLFCLTNKLKYILKSNPFSPSIKWGGGVMFEETHASKVPPWMPLPLTQPESATNVMVWRVVAQCYEV